MDTLSRLLAAFSLSARVFYNGRFCGSNEFLDEGKAGQLHLVGAGSVVMHHEEREALRIAVPSLVFYPRGLRHRLHVPEGDDVHLLCAEVLFDGGAQNALARALPDCVHWPLSADPTASRLLGVLFEEAQVDTIGQQLVLNRLCEALLVQVVRHAVRTCDIPRGMLAGLADPGLSRVLVAIHNEPAGDWTLEALASLSHMSRSKFARHFHQVVGMPPAEYVAGRRMELAQKLLLRRKAVLSVAHEVGYASQPAFTKAFTAHFGRSPRAWLQATRPDA